MPIGEAGFHSWSSAFLLGARRATRLLTTGYLRAGALHSALHEVAERAKFLDKAMEGVEAELVKITADQGKSARQMRAAAAPTLPCWVQRSYSTRREWRFGSFYVQRVQSLSGRFR